jgi:hypothetical protein
MYYKVIFILIGCVAINLGLIVDSTAQPFPGISGTACNPADPKAPDGVNADVALSTGNRLGQLGNPAAAICWLLIPATQGNASAMYNLGSAYLNLTPPDYAKVRYWYRKSADAGFARAMYKIGTLYDAGIGVPQDRDEAMRWMRKAAALGEKTAQAYVNQPQKDAWLAEATLIYREAVRKNMFEVDRTLSDGQTALHMLIENKVKDSLNFSAVLTCVGEKGAAPKSAELMLWLDPQDRGETIDIMKFSFAREYPVLGRIQVGDALSDRIQPDKMHIFGVQSLAHLTDEQMLQIGKGAVLDLLGRMYLRSKAKELSDLFLGHPVKGVADDVLRVVGSYYGIIFSDKPLWIGVHYKVQPSGIERDAEMDFDFSRISAARAGFLKKCRMPDPL